MNDSEKLSSGPCKPTWHKVVSKIKIMGRKLEMAEVMVAQGAEEEASEEVVLGQMEVVLNVRFLANLFIPCGRGVQRMG